MTSPSRLALRARWRQALVGLGLTLSIAWPTRAAAWGDDGHKIVAEIAWRYASPVARAELEKLLKEGKHYSLPLAATWADQVNRWDPSYAWASALHYVHIPSAFAQYDARRDCPSRACVVAAVKKYGDVLAKPEAPSEERLEALRFFVNFVGDLHQPLHVTHPDGAHGKRTKVKFEGADWTEYAVWEEGLVRLRQRRAGKSWKAVATELAEQKSSDGPSLAQVADVDAWVNESLRLSRGLRFAASGQTVDQGYVGRSMPVVEQQLRRAGVRLGVALSRIFAGRQWRQVGPRPRTTTGIPSPKANP